eukprot:scaffold37416_cov32-Tisochrysis_lutea.AAC.1
MAFPDIGHSLQQLLDFEPASQVEDTFGLCMQLTYEEFGQKLTHDLMPNGGEISVTQHNREEYVRLYTQYLLTDSIAPQFDAFLRGFETVCGGECLQLFRWEELELLICGSPDLDFEVSHAFAPVTLQQDTEPTSSPLHLAAFSRHSSVWPSTMMEKVPVLHHGFGSRSDQGARQSQLCHFTEWHGRGALAIGAHMLQPLVAAGPLLLPRPDRKGGQTRTNRPYILQKDEQLACRDVRGSYGIVRIGRSAHLSR